MNDEVGDSVEARASVARWMACDQVHTVCMSPKRLAGRETTKGSSELSYAGIHEEPRAS